MLQFSLLASKYLLISWPLLPALPSPKYKSSTVHNFHLSEGSVFCTSRLNLFSVFLLCQISLLKQSLELQMSQSKSALQQLQAQFSQEREHLAQQLQELALEHQHRECHLQEAHCCSMQDMDEEQQIELRVPAPYIQTQTCTNAKSHTVTLTCENMLLSPKCLWCRCVFHELWTLLALWTFWNKLSYQ